MDVGDYSLSEEDDGQVIKVQDMTKYPDYIPETFHTDIGIIELKHPVKFEHGLQTAWLPNPSLDLKPGTTVFAYGWGRLSYSKYYLCSVVCIYLTKVLLHKYKEA